MRQALPNIPSLCETILSERSMRAEISTVMSSNENSLSAHWTGISLPRIVYMRPGIKDSMTTGKAEPGIIFRPYPPKPQLMSARDHRE
jgi:hypothetical protein